MAWSTDDVMNFFKFQLRKAQAGGISATDLFYAFNSEQSSYQSDLTGRWQRANNTKQGSNTGLIENETIMTKLACVTQSTPITLTSGTIGGIPVAFGPKPSDFLYTLALRINGFKAFRINHDQIWAVNQDVIDPPSVATNTYYYTEYQGSYYFLPGSVTSAQLDYVQVAPDIVWAFTFDVNGRQVYDPINSVQPIWGQPTIVDICKRTLAAFGISFKDQDFEQAGEKNILTGDS